MRSFFFETSHFFISIRGCLTIKNNNAKEHVVNEEIKSLFPASKQFRVIAGDGEQLGLMTYMTAQNTAYDRGLDLVLIAQQADPPVCKIIDYGKFRFERDKREKEAKKKQQIMDIKEVQLTCQIDVNDFNTKVKNARRFLSAGNKVKVGIRFKGRQMSHTEVGRELLDRFRAGCEELCTMDKAPVLEGRTMTMFLTPVKQTPEKTPKAQKEAKAQKDESSGEQNAE